MWDHWCCMISIPEQCGHQIAQMFVESVGSHVTYNLDDRSIKVNFSNLGYEYLPQGYDYSQLSSDQMAMRTYWSFPKLRRDVGRICIQFVRYFNLKRRADQKPLNYKKALSKKVSYVILKDVLIEVEDLEVRVKKIFVDLCDSKGEAEKRISDLCSKSRFDEGYYYMELGRH